MNRRRDRLIARRFIDQLGMKDSMAIEQVLLMSTQQKIQLRTTVNRTWESQWRQVTISFMDYFTSEGVEQTPEHNTRKRTQRDLVFHGSAEVELMFKHMGCQGIALPCNEPSTQVQLSLQAERQHDIPTWAYNTARLCFRSIPCHVIRVNGWQKPV